MRESKGIVYFICVSVCMCARERENKKKINNIATEEEAEVKRVE